MSTSSDPQVEKTAPAQARRQSAERQINQQIQRLFEDVARLSDHDLQPADYYREYLPRVMAGIAAPAGAVWLCTEPGHLQLQFHIKLKEVGLDATESGLASHDELLRQALQTGRPMLVPPHSGQGPVGDAKVGAGNPTRFLILLAPILVEKQVIGLLQIFQDPERNPGAQRGFMQFVVQMASLASIFHRNFHLRQMIGQQHLWTQLEAFARQAHASLDTTETAMIVANEGRRLVECDRISVAVRHGRKCKVEAVSGTDVVEKRSNLVQLMRALTEHVVAWGEKLVYNGTKDDTLPPNVHKSLDAFLAESPSKFMVVLPLKDEREKDSKRPPRSALVMECFEPSAAPDQLMARLEVVGRHAVSALYNAVEHRRIPMRWIWMPLAKVQEGLGGKARAIGGLIGAAVVLLVLAMIFVPYPLKMEASGKLLPEDRRLIYAPVPGQVRGFEEGVVPGAYVHENQQLIMLWDRNLESQVTELVGQILTLDAEIRGQDTQLTNVVQSAAERNRISRERQVNAAKRTVKFGELQALRARTNADLRRPGTFYLRSPMNGSILNSDFQQTLLGRELKPSEPLLRIGNKQGRWEVELKIPQKHIGQVLMAFDPNDPSHELDVDLLVTSHPTQTYRGKLARNKIGGEATPNKDEHDESEPVVVAYVRIDGADIPEDVRIPAKLLEAADVEVKSKIRCGSHRMGYSLFYGLWEFFYENVIFAF